MNFESTSQALLLANALGEWTTPKLADAVFVAEAGFTREQCDLYQREWLLEILRGREQHNPPPEVPQPALQALRAAWQEMFTHFSTSVAYGEIALWGRLARPLARQHMERLSFKRAKHLLYHARTNTVFDGDQTYWAVVATRSSTTAAWEREAYEKRKADGRVTLAAALREWTDASLIGQVCHFERQHTAYELTDLPKRIVLSDPEDLAQTTAHGWVGARPDFTKLLAAWEALENDFRERLIRGEFHLTGVMTMPRREQQPEVLPGVWAADFAFDFQGGTLGLDDARYVAVTAAYGAAAQTDVDEGSAGDGRDCDPTEPTPSTAAEVPRQLNPGRKAARPTIEAALRAEWDALFPNGAPADPGPWIQLARRLIRRASTRDQYRGVGFPKEETVRKHISKIYPKMLVEKGIVL